MSDEKLDKPPYPGELGQRIFETATKAEWDEWIQIQTRLINENGLSAISPDHRKYLRDQMEKHFFGDGADEAKGYVPVK